jgi:outer membrane protein assembly factor BamB
VNRSNIPLTLLTAGFLTAATAADWPSWRGPTANGSVSQGAYPAKCEPGAALWKAPLPGKGCSTPIVWNQRIYLTAPVEGQDAALAFDWDGKPLWQTKLGKESGGKHRNGSGCNPSPATDGKTVVVYFKSGTLASLDLEGKVLWQTNLIAAYGPETLYWDQGTSPVLTRECVVIARMHQGESWLAAFDKKSGALRWKVPRNFETPIEGEHAYTTPLVFVHQGAEAVLVWGGQHLTAHSAADGKQFWVCGDFNPQAAANWPAVASPIIAGDMAVVACGRADRGIPRLYGVRLGGSGDVTPTHKLWKREDTGTFVPTPAEYKGSVYIVRDRGEVDCIDPKSGKTLWQDAFPRASANFYASPLVANGLLYAIREDGVIFVARVEEKFELLSETQMGERIIASPVPVSGRLFIRGEKNLYCLGEK